VAVAARPSAKPVVIHVPHDERFEPRIAIYVGRGSNRRLATTVEVLSLSNKTPGEQGRGFYLKEQREVLYGKVHLIEIDLLRGGQHATAVPYQRLMAATGPFDYHVSIHHFDNLEDFFVHPIRLDEPLPEISIPLLPGDDPVQLNLQGVFQRTYDAGPYGREIDYRKDTPVPPLPAERMTWVTQLISHSVRADA
jgi:hypothetical protein